MMNRVKDVEPIASPSRVADGDLLAQFVKRRDDSAFADLVARHGRMVFGVCLRRLGQSADAEDAFQAVFLSLAKHAEGLASRTTVGPWLYTVVRQVTTKALRSRRRLRWLPWSLAPEPKTAETFEVDVDLDAALASLSESERAAIVLCHLEGLSRSEAAKALGCPEGTLSARLSRGLEKLRKKLGKPPLAVLVAASLVMLPDRLPASTVDLVHHFRDGALDDWASPGTLDFYRKADPMRYLHRAGPIVASVMAVGLIAIGASFGWNLLQAQQDKKPEEKSKVGDDRPRGGIGGEGVDASGGGTALGGRRAAIGGMSGGGKSDVGGLRGGGRGGVAGGMEESAMGMASSAGPSRGMSSGAGADGAFGDGMSGGPAGGVAGMMIGMEGHVTKVTLEDAVRQFNNWAKSQEIGKTQPPLTEDEVVAAIRAWRGEEGGSGSTELYKAFQNIADARTLPNAWRLSGADRFRFNNYHLDVWRIELSISLGPHKNASVIIRDQKIRVRPEAKTEQPVLTTQTALITIPLKNSNAESVAEVLSKAISGKWLETKVTADSRTNSLIILAPKAKEESIRKTVQALDELQK